MAPIRVFLRGELIWLAPLVGLGLIALSLIRPEPVIPSPAFPNSVIITDAQGDQVPVPMPPQGVSSAYLRSYLPKTHMPGLLLRLGHPRDRKSFAASLTGWLYPELQDDDKRWSSGPFNLESILAEDRAGTLYFGNDPAALRRFGLTALSTLPPPDTPELSEPGMTERAHVMFSEIRVLNAALGQPEYSERLIATYLRDMRQLRDELRPETIEQREWHRVLGMGARSQDWENVFVTDSTGNRPYLAIRSSTEDYKATGRKQDAERILTMNPDYIVLLGNTTEDFSRDPRWQGLDAVRNHRVYTNNPDFHGYIYDLDNLPSSSRWLAEIFHPERLAPKTRQAIRDHYRQSYGFEMSEEQIDLLLKVEENATSVGYERFTRTVSEPTP